MTPSPALAIPSPTLIESLRSKYCTLGSAIGNILALVGAGHLLPLLVLPFYPDEARHAPAFLAPALLGVIIGMALVFRLRSRRRSYPLSVQDGGILVVAVWGGAMLLGALPFWLGGQQGFLNALFESVSGWTTTGLSVLPVDETAHIYLMWRSLTQFFGALGVVLIALVALIGTSAHTLYQAEGRSALLIPNIRRTVKLITGIYLGLTVAMTGLYFACGMDLFDALNHAMCTVSTGGFSSRGASFGHWDSWKLDLLSVALMFVASTNYATHFLLLRGEWRSALRNREWRLAGALLAVSVPASLVALASLSGYGWTFKGLRVALFETMAALSSTGFTSVTYERWPDLALFALTLLMLIGGGTGSTAGGIKQYRIYILLKAVGWEVRKRLLPRRAVVSNKIWSGGQWEQIDSAHISSVAVFVFLYLLVYVAGVFVFLAHGYGLGDSLFEMASSLSTIGLSVGITGPAAPAAIRITQMVAMVLGRLEMLIVVYGLLQLGRDQGVWRSARPANASQKA